MQVLVQVAALFLLMLCGWWASWRKTIPEAGFSALNRVLLNYSLPCLTIVKLQQSADAALIGELTQVFLLGGLSILLCGGVAALLFYRAGKEKALYISMCMFSNAGFMGFPVVVAALGEGAMIYCVVYVAVFNLLTWSIGPALFGCRSLKSLLNPVLMAGVVGVVLFLAEIRLPQMVVSMMDMMGATTTPLALFLVGARLVTLRWKDCKNWRLLLACGLRLLALPLMVYGLLLLAGVPSAVRMVVSLCTAMPCAATLSVQAEMYGGNKELGAQAVALSTVLSVATIPLMTLLIR